MDLVLPNTLAKKVKNVNISCAAQKIRTKRNGFNYRKQRGKQNGLTIVWIINKRTDILPIFEGCFRIKVLSIQTDVIPLYFKATVSIL